MKHFYIVFGMLALFVFVLLSASSDVFAANKLRISGDNAWVGFVNGEKVAEGNDWQVPSVTEFKLLPSGGAVIAVYVHDAEPGAAGRGGALADIVLDGGGYFGSDKTWKAQAGKPIAERKDGWERVSFDDSKWDSANQMDQFGAGIWGFGAPKMREKLKDPDSKAYWVWAGPNDVADDIYLRFKLPGTVGVEPSGKLATTWANFKQAHK